MPWKRMPALSRAEGSGSRADPAPRPQNAAPQVSRSRITHGEPPLVILLRLTCGASPIGNAPRNSRVTSDSELRVARTRAFDLSATGNCSAVPVTFLPGFYAAGG